MTKLGELLKAEREKRGLSLHEIGMGLKINPKILKAIEEGDPQNLPAKTFLRGFVKSYAQYLRMDLTTILQLFQEEYGTTRPEEPAKTQAQQPTPTAASPTPAPRYENSLKRPDDSALPVANNNRIYTILVAILLLTLIAFVAKMMDKYQKESEVAKVSVVDASTSTTSTVPGEATEAAGAGVISSDATVASTTTMLPSETSATLTTTTLLSSTTTMAPRSTPSTTVTTTTLKPTTTTTTTVTTTTVKPTTTTSTTTSTTSTSTTVPGVKTANTEVILEALNRVNIRFSLNGGQKWETLELNQDQVHTFRSKSGVQLEISDGGAINVILNGRDRGVPGTIGKPIKLTFP